MVWDYRVVRDPRLKDEQLQICEVFFDDDGTPWGYCPASIQGSDIAELREELMSMLAILEAEVVDATTLGPFATDEE